MIRYRGFEITRKWVTRTGKPQPDEYEWCHPDYDGPGDPRFGTGVSVRDCEEQIDDLFDDDPPDQYREDG